MKSRFWGYRTGERGGKSQFVMLANANGSSSCRLFEARSGALISYNTSRGAGNYEAAYGGIFRDCREVISPPGIKTSELVASLPQHHLLFLQAQVGIEALPMAASVPQPAERGILAGTRELIDAALGQEVGFDSKAAALRLSKSALSLNAAVLLDRLYERIVQNWDRSECRSTQLWRGVAKTDIAAQNASPEKTLEKAIAEWVPGWFNQIPTASGLLIGVEERHRNVDLGHFVVPGHLELVELKAGPHADTPLKAAFEIVGYGLLYCFARGRSIQLGLPRGNRLLDARRVDLKVLAPRGVYAPYQLKWLGTALDIGFQQFARHRFTGTLEMGFCFECFPENFHWPGTPGYQLPKVLESRVQAWP
jgi:hypothetical protein